MGKMPIARLQACYDGVLGARAMHRRRNFGNDIVYDNNAHTVSTSYAG